MLNITSKMLFIAYSFWFLISLIIILLSEDLDKFAKAAQEGGKGLEDALNIEAKDLDGLEDACEVIVGLFSDYVGPVLH